MPLLTLSSGALEKTHAMTRSTRCLRVVALLAPSLLVAAACGGAGKGAPVDTFDAGTDGARHDATHGAPDTGALHHADGATSDSNTPEACATTMKAATPPAPLDMIILLDRSGSMTYNNAWTYETQALNQFFYDTSSDGISVGLLYLPQLALCDITAYSTPAVPVSLLPGAQGALITSLASTRPFGGTPITVGLEGAVAYAKQRQKEAPTHEVVIVFSTDGTDINSCGVVPDGGGLPNTLDNAIKVLHDAATGPHPIRTFVIGVLPEPQTDLFAAAGGTGKAILIGAGDGGSVDIEGELISAFKNIRDQVHIPCTYAIPPSTGGSINFGDVNVSFTSAPGATADKFFGAKDAADCEKKSNDWYYDDPTAPKSIIFCPTACQLVTASTTGTVNIEFGCTPTVPPPPSLR
jgi:Mg-chelatase subunit ChlD